MTMGGALLSVSLVTVEFTPTGGGPHGAAHGGTDLGFTEQGTYFDGPVPAAGQPADREHGCRELYEALARELDRLSREEP